jgi:ABC-2 type transport system permease protein
MLVDTRSPGTLWLAPTGPSTSRQAPAVTVRLTRCDLGPLLAVGRMSEVRSAGELDRLVRSGTVQFAIEIPASFDRDVRRGDRPSILVIADATDPVATGTAISAVQGLVNTALRRELRGPDASITKATSPFQLVLQRRYNPEGITQYNIVPGLLGVILTMTMFTALAVTREIERGTMESLLSMPIKPVEIMIGKIAPFVLVGFVQMTNLARSALSLRRAHSRQRAAARYAVDPICGLQPGGRLYLFDHRPEPVAGGADDVLLFPANFLLSGFAFPFRGMPQWAQAIGETLPLTHFIRIVRGIRFSRALTSPTCKSTSRRSRFSCSPPWDWRCSVSAAPSTRRF